MVPRLNVPYFARITGRAQVAATGKLTPCRNPARAFGGVNHLLMAHFKTVMVGNREGRRHGEHRNHPGQRAIGLREVMFQSITSMATAAADQSVATGEAA